MNAILKRILSAVATLTVMLTAVVFDVAGTVVAEAALSTSAPGGCDGTHSGMTAWTSTTTLPTSGSYYLDADVNVSSQKNSQGIFPFA